MAASRKSLAFWIRLCTLGLALLVVAGYAFRRERVRGMRTDWLRPLTVRVLLVSEAPVPDATSRAWREGLPALERWMGEQFARYRPGAAAPVTFELAGPVRTAALPSLEPPSDSVWEGLRFARGLAAELDRLDEAAGARERAADARLYVLLEEGMGRSQQVEGLGEAGGNVGLVRSDLRDTELALALTAVAHELFHCLGATDKYDAQGRASGLSALAEPDATPLFPQRYAEVMVGERALTSDRGVLPTSLAEVAVGPLTARELRWTE